MRGFLVPANANEIAAGGATHFEIVFGVKQSTARFMDNSSGLLVDLVAPQNSTTDALPDSFLDTVPNSQTAGSDVDVSYLNQAVQAHPFLLAALVAAVCAFVLTKFMREIVRLRAQDARHARLLKSTSHVSDLPGTQQVMLCVKQTFGPTLQSPTPSPTTIPHGPATQTHSSGSTQRSLSLDVEWEDSAACRRVEMVLSVNVLVTG